MKTLVIYCRADGTEICRRWYKGGVQNAANRARQYYAWYGACLWEVCKPGITPETVS